jgi:uncharacterized protein HemX
VVDVSTAAPAGALTLTLATLVGYLLKQYGTDRARDQAAIAAEQERTKAAEARTLEALAAEKAAQAQVDVERALRRNAESSQALAEAQLQVQQMKTQWLMGEIDRLQPRPVPPGELSA